jgi:hypothetical protein
MQRSHSESTISGSQTEGVPSTIPGASEGVPSEMKGESTHAERALNVWASNAIHVFLSLLAVTALAAAAIASVHMVARDIPALWRATGDTAQLLHGFVQDLLMLGIAAELALLLLFHRASAAVEVLLFVIARRLVGEQVNALELLLGSLALSSLIVVRFFFIHDRPKAFRRKAKAGHA